MKRRTFLGLLAATFTLPPIKIPVAAAPVAAAPVAAAQDHFWVAKLVAETKGAISVEGLMTQLRLDRSMAREVQHLLFKEGIVSAPKAGLATALKPWKIPALAQNIATPQVGTKLNFGKQTARDPLFRKFKQFNQVDKSTGTEEPKPSEPFEESSDHDPLERNS